jgi:hypothetical protein
LHLRIIDRAGHLVAHGCLARYHLARPSGGAAARSRIEYCVNIDPSLLRELVDAFAGVGE